MLILSHCATLKSVAGWVSCSTLLDLSPGG